MLLSKGWFPELRLLFPDWQFWFLLMAYTVMTPFSVYSKRLDGNSYSLFAMTHSKAYGERSKYNLVNLSKTYRARTNRESGFMNTITSSTILIIKNIQLISLNKSAVMIVEKCLNDMSILRI